MDNIDALIAQADRELTGGGDNVDALIAQAEREANVMPQGTYTPLPKPGAAPAAPTGIWDTAQALMTNRAGETPQQSFDMAMRDEPDAGLFNPAIRTVQGTVQGVEHGIVSAAKLVPDALAALGTLSPFSTESPSLPKLVAPVTDAMGVVHGALSTMPVVQGWSLMGNTALELQRPEMPYAGQVIGKNLQFLNDLPLHTVNALGGQRLDPTQYADPNDKALAELQATMHDAAVLGLTAGAFGKAEQAVARRLNGGQMPVTAAQRAEMQAAMQDFNFKPQAGRLPESVTDAGLYDATGATGMTPFERYWADEQANQSLARNAQEAQWRQNVVLGDMETSRAEMMRETQAAREAARRPTSPPEVPGMVDGNRPQVLEALHQSLIEVGVESADAARRVARLAPSQRDAIFNDANAWRDWVNQNRATNLRGETGTTAGTESAPTAPTGADLTTQPTPITAPPQPILAKPVPVVDTAAVAGPATGGSLVPNAASENGPSGVSLTAEKQVGGSLVPEPVQPVLSRSAQARKNAWNRELPWLHELLIEHGGLMSPAEAKRQGRFERLAGEYDDIRAQSAVSHNSVFSNGTGGKGKMSPDQAVQLLINQGIFPRDASVTDLWNRLSAESASHVKLKAQVKAQEAAERAQSQEHNHEMRLQSRFETEANRPTKQREPVPVNELVIGSKFKLKGEKFEVIAIDADTGNVTVKDGPTFGIRELKADTTFFIEKETLKQPRLSKSAPDVFDEAKKAAGEKQESGDRSQETVSEPVLAKPATPGELAAEQASAAARTAKADVDGARTRAHNAQLELDKASTPETRKAMADAVKAAMQDVRAAEARLAQAQAATGGTQGDLGGIGGAGTKPLTGNTGNLAGEANTLFTQSAYEAALARERARMGRTNIGVDPTAIADMVIVGGYHLERLAREGVKSFEKWAKAMRAEYGTLDKPQLKAVWKELAQQPEIRGLVTHKFVERVDASAEIDMATKARLTEREYQPIKDATRREQVQAAAEGLTVEQVSALARDKNQTMPDDKRMWLAAEAGTRLKQEIQAAREMGDTAEVARLAKEQAAVLDTATTMYEQAGRTLRTARYAFADVLGEMTRETLGDWATKRLQSKMKQLTPEQRAVIDQMAADAEAAPAGFQRAEKLADLVRHVDRQTGVPFSNLLLDIYYTHIFSGIGTHLRNVVDTNLNVLNETAILAANQLITGNPAAAGEILIALARGYGRGIRDAGGVMRTGVASGTHISQLETQSALDSMRFRGGRLNPLNAYKYVRRGLAAEDVTAFRAAEEAKAFDVAYRQARQSGLSRQAARLEARKQLGLTADQRAAQLARAQTEGIKGNRLSRRVAEIREQGRSESITDPAVEFGRRATYNADMQGSLAALGDAVGSMMNKAPVLRLIQPVVRIPINVFNRGLDYTPWGTVRATLGRRGNFLTGEWRDRYNGKMTAGERLTALEKSVGGTLAMAGIAAMAAQFMDDENPLFWVHGRGPLDPRQRVQWMNAGGKPYSWKINDQYVSYAYTPLVLPMAALGGVLDQLRYNNKKLSMQDAGTQLAAAFTAMSSAMMEQAFLSGLKDFIDGISDPRSSTRRNMLTGVARKFGNIAVPNAVRDVERMIDPQATDARNIPQSFTNPFPGLRQAANPVLTDVLGQPVVRPRLKMVEAFTTVTTDDPVKQLLHQRQLWVPDVSRNRAEGQTPFTEDQYYQYRETAGRILNTYLDQRRGDLSRLPQADAQALVQQLAEQARKEARNQLGLNAPRRPRLSRAL